MRWASLSPRLGGRFSLTQLQLTYMSARHASLNSAIERGIRRSQNSKNFSPRRSDVRDDRRSLRKDVFRTPSRGSPRDDRRSSPHDDFRTLSRSSPREDRRNSRHDDFRAPSREKVRDDRRSSRQDESRAPSRMSVRNDRRGSRDELRAPSGVNVRDNRRSLRQDEVRNPSRRYQERERAPRQEQDLSDFDGEEFVRTGRVQPARRDRASDQRKPRFEAREMRSSVKEEIKDKPSKSRAHRKTEGMPERVKEHVKVPDSIPYTSPASEFIYGTNAVEAALRCSRRQLYKLYLYQAGDEELSPAKVALRKLALSKDVGVKMAFGGWDRLLDKMSAGRPHNGCVLEVSPLPKLPVRGLHPVLSVSESHIRVELAPQSREEAAVNGTDDRVPILHAYDSAQRQQVHRFPVVLLLDGVVDPGNLGAIIRSAYFLGVDAIVFAGRNSAPLSPVTIKASAGAAENMPLLRVMNEVDFIQRSKSNGWRFYAADAPGPGVTFVDRLSNENSDGHSITQSPVVLMMGSEGSGLSSHIKSHADGIVSIPGVRHSAELGVESDPARIDSLNVSVAAALLMEMFLRTPLGISEPVKKGKDRMW